MRYVLWVVNAPLLGPSTITAGKLLFGGGGPANQESYPLCSFQNTPLGYKLGNRFLSAGYTRAYSAMAVRPQPMKISQSSV